MLLVQTVRNRALRTHLELIHQRLPAGFDSAMMHVEGREQFLAGAGADGWPEQAVTTLVAEAYDGEHAFQLYTGSNGGKNVKIAEHLVIRDGQLASSEVVVDSAAFLAFMAD